jgi:hypothetical protein
MVIQDKDRCTNPATCCWLVEGKIGFCHYENHKPGEGVVVAVQAYMAGLANVIKVQDPVETEALYARSNLKQQIAMKLSELIDGYLYSYRNKADGIPKYYDPKRDQRPLKCGKSVDMVARFKRQETEYKGKSEDIELVGSTRMPCIVQVDSYMRARLRHWKLPSRAADGGTEWYYISLETVKRIWSEAFQEAKAALAEHDLAPSAWSLVP